MISKKAEFSAPNKAFGTVFMIFVVFFIAFLFFPNLNEGTKNNISAIELDTMITLCETGSCNIQNCEDESKCDEREIEKWEKYLAYVDDCKKKVQEDPSNDDCDNEFYNQILAARDGVEFGGTKLSKTSISNFLSSSFYTTNKAQFEKYANENNLDVEVLYAIVIKEGGYNRAFENSVRFECHHFNKKSSDKVKCTIGDGGFSETPSETNYDAYKRAYEINPGLAIRSSSSGFAQLLGSSYEILKFPIDDSKGIEQFQSSLTQVDYFNAFLKNNVGLENLRSQDWPAIAKAYNGDRYRFNNYDSDIQFAYNELKSQISVS